MTTIEFVGIARSGKTTVAKYLEQSLPDLTFYPERHDLVPKELWNDNYKHNEWYARYCVDNFNKSLSNPGIHLFERGILDRIIIGNVYYKMKWFTKEQLDYYLSLLTPCVKRLDKAFVFLIPVEISVQRAKEIGKDVTKAIPYMENLYEEYKKLKDWFPKAIYLPENATLEELKDLTLKSILKGQ